MHSFLPRAVESVTSQDYENIELIVVDDGSDKPVNSDQFAVDNIEFMVLEMTHGGKARAVNRGFEAATGEYFAILDADDQLPEGSLSSRIDILEQNKADLSIGSFEVHYDGKVTSKRLIDKFLDKSNTYMARALLRSIIAPFHQNGMVFTRKLLDRVGHMNPTMLRGQEMDFAVRLLEESKKTVFVKESVYIYNRYDRPFTTRMYNRCVGMKYKFLVIARYTSGWRRITYLAWAALIEGAKLVHDLFGIYKK